MKFTRRWTEWLTSDWRIGCLAAFGIVLAVLAADIASPVFELLDEERRIRSAPVVRLTPAIVRNRAAAPGEQFQVGRAACQATRRR